MKNINVLSLLTLLAFGQIYGGAAPDISFISAYRAIDELTKTISSDNDDAVALNLLQIMNICIAFDLAQQQALKATQDTFMFKGTPLDSAKIAAAHKELQSNINASNSHIKKLSKSKNNNNKLNNNQQARNEAQANLDATIAAINENQSSMTVAQAGQKKIGALRAKNALVLEQAIESYVGSLGQCYTKQGVVVISSKYNQNLPITPKEFNQLITTLNNSFSQFGSNVMITLELQGSAPVTIDNVAKSINNMPLSSSSYASWALFGLKAAAVTAATVAAGAIAYNVYQGKNWNDTTDAQNTVAGAQAVTQAQLDNAYQAYQRNIAPGAKAMSESAWANAQGLYSSTSQATTQSSQAINDWYNSMLGTSAEQPAA